MPLTTGVRFGLESGRGATAVPTRATLIGAATGVVLAVATLVFAGSIDSVVTTPRPVRRRLDGGHRLRRGGRRHALPGGRRGDRADHRARPGGRGVGHRGSQRGPPRRGRHTGAVVRARRQHHADHHRRPCSRSGSTRSPSGRRRCDGTGWASATGCTLTAPGYAGPADGRRSGGAPRCRRVPGGRQDGLGRGRRRRRPAALGDVDQTPACCSPPASPTAPTGGVRAAHRHEPRPEWGAIYVHQVGRPGRRAEPRAHPPVAARSSARAPRRSDRRDRGPRPGRGGAPAPPRPRRAQRARGDRGGRCGSIAVFQALTVAMLASPSACRSA